jgi:hypothetical protein
MSLVPKTDELREVIHNSDVEIACITETWLRDHIDDNVVNVSGFRLVRLDRINSQHGGVCMYVRNNIQCNIVQDLLDSNFEIVWVHIRPTRLPRGIPSIIIGTLYHPPSANNQARDIRSFIKMSINNRISFSQQWHHPAWRL